MPRAWSLWQKSAGVSNTADLISDIKSGRISSVTEVPRVLSFFTMQDTWSASVGSCSRRSSVSVNSYDTTDLLSPGLGKINKKIYEEYFPELFTY